MAWLPQDLRPRIFGEWRRLPCSPWPRSRHSALGLGVTSAVLSVAHAIFLKPLPVPDPSRVVLVDATVPRQPPHYAFGLSYPDYLFHRDHVRTFETLAAHFRRRRCRSRPLTATSA